MNVSFNELKYLVTVVADDLLNDDFGNFQDGMDSSIKSLSDVSEEMYDKVLVLKDLLSELYDHRPLPF